MTQIATKRTEGKILVDYGMKDYYKYYSNLSKNPVSNLKFNKVISQFNSKIVDLIINESLEFRPTTLQMTFCVRKYKKVIRIKDGKLVNNTPIDWKTTNELWENDSKAKDKKILIRYLNNHTSKFVFRIKALKNVGKYANKGLFKFKPCRGFQRALAKRILDPKQDNFEAYKLY